MKIRISMISMIMTFMVLASALVAYAQNLTWLDSFDLTDTMKISQQFTFYDTFNLSDTLLTSISNIIKVITTTMTSIITVIGNTCTGGSCYNGDGSIYSIVIIPAILIIVTGFGFMYMGVKFFGVFVMVESFVLLSLSLLGIIPTWFTLLVILFVSAAMTRIVISFFRGT